MLGLPFQLPQEEVAWQPSLRPEEPPVAAPGTQGLMMLRSVRIQVQPQPWALSQLCANKEFR